MHHKYIRDSVSVSPVEGSQVVGSGGGPVTSETHAESSSHTYQHSACSSQPEEWGQGVKMPSLQCSNVQQKDTAIYQLLLYKHIADSGKPPLIYKCIVYEPRGRAH